MGKSSFSGGLMDDDVPLMTGDVSDKWGSLGREGRVQGHSVFRGQAFTTNVQI